MSAYRYDNRDPRWRYSLKFERDSIWTILRRIKPNPALNRRYTRRALERRKRFDTDEVIFLYAKSRAALICLDGPLPRTAEEHFFVNPAHEYRRQPILELGLTVRPNAASLEKTVRLLDIWFGASKVLTEEELRARYQKLLGGTRRA